MCKANVLIVEDEFIIAENLSATLAECGYRVEGIADNVDSVIKTLSENQIDMILLDINLNQAVDGVEIAHIVNSRFGIPFIFVTAFVDPATIERVKHTYPYGYIVKPYSDIDIKIAIDIALSRAANASAGKSINKSVQKENTVFIKTDRGLKKLEINEILWMEAYDYYSFIHTSVKRFLQQLL
jgi:DNA-binding LytR/AlgR family response regulator